MDSNILTTIITLIVALITGLIAYSASLSSKEKETKLLVYERLGIESHAAVESLQNNTEWLIQYLQMYSRKLLRRNDLIQANEKVKVDIDKLRELRVKIMFFDKKIFLDYDDMLNTHGEILPKLLGYASTDGTKPVNPMKKYTFYEKKHYLFKLQKLLTMIEAVKEKITNETSKKYNQTLSSSLIINVIIFICVAITISLLLFLPIKKDEPQNAPINNIIIYK